jgi:HSP20 family protein
MAVLRFEPFRDPFDRLMSLAATGTRTPLGMPIDIYRSDDGSYHVETDLPGVDPANIEVTVEHSTLTIKGDLDDRAEPEHELRVAVTAHPGADELARSV